jgi:PPM family protein phosphatase
MALTVANKAVKSDVGRQRDHNEDSAIEVEPMFMLADGMGGAQAGEVASQTAAKVFSAGPGKDGTPEERLTQLAQEANAQIYKLAQADEAKRGMGTTLTAALVEGDGVTVAHVGDSRVYRLREGEFEQLTHDHSLVAELERSGEISHEEAFDHPSKSVITRALGPEPDVDVDAHTHSARPGDTYLMSSDGLTDMITDDEIASILKSSDSLDDAAESLIRAANQSGGRDNITVVLFTLEEGEDEPEGVSEDTVVRGLSATDVHEAVKEQERAGRAATVPRESLDRATTVPRQTQPASRGGRRRQRRWLAWLGGLVLLAGVCVAAVLGARQVYFVGTNEAGLVTLYRGVPYELPFGVDLYSEHYSSSVPARTIGKSRRERVLDHEWRSRDDAEDLVRQLERGTLDLGRAFIRAPTDRGYPPVQAADVRHVGPAPGDRRVGSARG